MVILGQHQGRVDSNFYQASIVVLVVLFMWQVLVLFVAMKICKYSVFCRVQGVLKETWI